MEQSDNVPWALDTMSFTVRVVPMIRAVCGPRSLLMYFHQHSIVCQEGISKKYNGGEQINDR
jgi:hypothetical protein